MPQHDEKPPPRWIHVSSWVATTGLLSLLLNLGSASAAIQAASASRPSEGKMRCLLAGQTEKDPQDTSENPESATPLELRLGDLQQHWAWATRFCMPKAQRCTSRPIKSGTAPSVCVYAPAS